MEAIRRAALSSDQAIRERLDRQSTFSATGIEIVTSSQFLKRGTIFSSK